MMMIYFLIGNTIIEKGNEIRKIEKKIE